MSVESIDFSDNENDTLFEKETSNQSLDSLMDDLGNMVKTPHNNNEEVSKFTFFK